MKEKIYQAIAGALGVDVSVITSDLSVGDIPEWDSVGNLAIISTIEEQLAVEIPLDDLFDLTSVQAIVDEVTRLKHSPA